MKITLAILTIIHALIHTLGFIKSIYPEKLQRLTIPIGRGTGFLWLASSFLFITTVILFLYGDKSWVYFGIVSVMISQFVIIKSWRDALTGTLANVLLVIVIFLKIKGYM